MTSEPLQEDKDERARESNRRAWRIADGRGGMRTVYDAAVSRRGVESLRQAAARLVTARMQGLERDRALRARGRLQAFSARLGEMAADGVKASDMGWSPELGTALQGVLPTRMPGGKGTGGARAAEVVSRLLGELPANDGLTALAVVVEGADLPEPVVMNGHGSPLLPTSVALVGPGSLFANQGHFAVHTRLDSGLRVSELPVLERDIEGPLLPLALYNLLAAPGCRKGGHGAADLALRIYIEGLCSVMQRDWQRSECRPVLVSTTLREFLTWFYPNRRPRPSEYWPRLMAACAALDREETRVPWRDRETGHSGLRRVVSLVDIPRGPEALEDTVGIAVHLPPGSTCGPKIQRSRMRYWGYTSEPAYRALVALAYQWHRPGYTRVPGNGGWVQSQDPKVYEEYSPNRIIELCYPTSVNSNRRLLASRAWKVLRRLDEAGDVRIVGKRILPPPQDAEIIV
ncbi:MAG: hypothetical protein OXG04_03665 [Acidobacteria bacterium]|nr:hypothetical protein [Acidobacteriota bacterium]